MQNTGITTTLPIGAAAEFHNAVEQKGKQFLANLRFLRNYVGKQVPKRDVIKYTASMMNACMYLAHDYIVDNNVSYDLTAMIFDKSARMEYLKKIVGNQAIHELVFLRRGINVQLLSNGIANIIYPNGDKLELNVAAAAPLAPLSNINHLVELEIQARKTVEDAEQVLIQNDHPYDKKLGDVLIKYCFIAQCHNHGYIGLDSDSFYDFLTSEKLQLTPSEFVRMFSNEPRTLVEIAINGLSYINDVIERPEIEVAKSQVLDDKISEQTGVSTRMIIGPDEAADESFALKV